MIDGEDIQAMKKIIQPSFNSKIIGKDESLLSLMKKFDDTPFRQSEPNFKKIAQLLKGSDMLKTNPKSLHSKLPAIWNWVYEHMRDSNNEFSEEFKSPLKNFSSPRNSITPKGGLSG